MGRINKYGYTGIAYPPERKKNTLRIALVGDSYVQGHYMSDKYYFGNIIGRNLQTFLQQKELLSGLKHQNSENTKNLKLKIEILNFGIAGSNLQRMYIRFKNQVSKFKT